MTTEALTVAELVAESARRLEAGDAYFGHGTATARDEAAYLVFDALGLEHARQRQAYRMRLSAEQVERVRALVARRVTERRPTAYLLGEAWFAGLRFYCDERVLVPRSPFAELIQERFQPWVEPTRVRHILEIGTGSGCIAVACARAFPGARVLATDISAGALEVAARNIRRHDLAARISLVQADLFAGLSGRFDLIVSNPPYVPATDLARFPREYHYEPRIALVSGPDGMETPSRILQHARRYLDPAGWLALEVGEGAVALEARFPGVPLIWPELASGGDGIALVAAADLPDRA